MWMITQLNGGFAGLSMNLDYIEYDERFLVHSALEYAHDFIIF